MTKRCLTPIAVALALLAPGVASAQEQFVGQPDSPLADVCEARLLINQTEWREAASLLRHVTSRHANLPVVSALYALCLFMQHDDEWRRAATEAVGTHNDTAIAIVARFLNVPADEAANVHGPDLSTRVQAAIETSRALEHS